MNYLLRGRWANVEIDTALPGCQAIEREALGTPEEVESYCGLPPFVRVYRAETMPPVVALLCWRHLHALGDTGELTVRPA